MWSGYLLTVELGAPSRGNVQSFLIVFLAMSCFTTAIRYQLNPISGNHRNRPIRITLLTDPYQDDVRMKRDYLLVGADWTGKLCVQSVLEMVAFTLSVMPLVLAARQWYVGDPNVARFCGVRIALSVLAWIVLFVTWPR